MWRWRPRNAEASWRQARAERLGKACLKPPYRRDLHDAHVGLGSDDLLRRWNALRKPQNSKQRVRFRVCTACGTE
eukprot:scaffold340_cov256-Pinguiococcus_pyrenoidosus.AAC.30